MNRREELAGNLEQVRARLARACAAAGREPGDVALVAVTKTWPAEDVAHLHALGLRAFAENRDRELVTKAAALADLPDVRWHFVGQLQTNKAASVAGCATVVQSLDRPSLATALSRGAERAGRALEVLLQVSLDGDPARGGALPQDLPDLAAQVASLPALVLGGVMAVAPREADPAEAFARLAALAASLQAGHPGARTVSAGMSGDLEQAVAAGATSVRVGTALLGSRPPPSR